jgi:hypothetical protein
MENLIIPRLDKLTIKFEEEQKRISKVLKTQRVIDKKGFMMTTKSSRLNSKSPENLHRR